jgi:DNA-binding transcriptional regulator GbsR (MarR family)
MMSRDPLYEGAKKHIIDACVQSAKSKGYSDACGVLRGTLFLADRPLSLDDLVEETGYSKSTVCLNMNLLENLGIAKRVAVPGDKRSRYVALSDANAMKAALLANIKKEVQAILSALDQTQRDLGAMGDDGERTKQRISSLRHFYEQTDELLDLVGRYTTEELIELLKRERH